jgi:hypothetical protein
MVSRDGDDRVSCSSLCDIGTCRGAATFARETAIGDDRIGIGGALGTASDRSFVVVHITTAAAGPSTWAPGGVYIGGGPVYVIPAPSNGNGTYVEPTYGYGYGVPEPTPYLAVGSKNWSEVEFPAPAREFPVLCRKFPVYTQKIPCSVGARGLGSNWGPFGVQRL